MLSLFILIASACLSCSDFLFVPAWYVPWLFPFPLLDSGFHCLLQKEHCPHSLAYATYLCAVPLWCSSAIRLSPGSCHIFHCKVKASRLPKISLALFASQKDWQPSTLLVLTIVEPAHARHDLSNLNSALAYSQPSVFTFHLSVFTFKSGYSSLFP